MKLKYLIIAITALLLCHKAVVWLQPGGQLLGDLGFSRQVLDRNGKLLRLTLAKDDAYRLRTRLDKISPLAVEAALLYEDRYFYYHPGINPMSLARAFWTTYVQKKRVVGASTITMQLSRYLFKIDSRSIGGKLAQICRAFQIEFCYTKEAILEAYLNTVPYGFNIEGIAAASRIYFQKKPMQLSLLEALTLTVIPQSPHRRTRHITAENAVNENLRQARTVLLNQWMAAHPQNMDKRSDFSLDLEMNLPKQLPFSAPHFVTDILQSTALETVQTTLDSSIQSAFERIVSQYVHRRSAEGIENACAMLVDTATMETLAVIGSSDFFNDRIAGQVNGTRARRSPGSALKPFVYALSIDQGVIHPYTMLKDTPTPFGTYTPDNFDRAFSGPLSATDALIHSRNIPAIHLASAISDPGLHSFLKHAGIRLNDDPNHYGLSLVLGTAEVSMEDLIRLYAMLLNKGQLRPLNKLVHSPYREGDALLSKESCFLLIDMLSKNPRPAATTGDRWQLRKRHIAWKTGTSVGYRDAWAIGVFDHYALAVWVGNFSGRGNRAFVGRRAAGPLLFELAQALENLDDVHFDQFDPGKQLNLKQVQVCALSGQIPNDDCPFKKTTWFIPGVSPFTQCAIHRRLTIDTLSGFQICPGFEGPTTSKVFEFWPTDLLAVFKQAGLNRRVPPALHSDCRQDAYGDIGPKIISPKKNIVYNLRSKGSDSKQIPLIAVGDGNVTHFSWSIDYKPIGTTKAHYPLLWDAVPGHHLVSVYDTFGRTATTSIYIKWVD
jgi:penicillin-binding protein 1C